MRIRQQDPVTKLWSMCEINSFLSAGGARCSIRISGASTTRPTPRRRCNPTDTI